MCCLRAASAPAPVDGRPKAVGTTSRCRCLGLAGAFLRAAALPRLLGCSNSTFGEGMQGLRQARGSGSRRKLTEQPVSQVCGQVSAHASTHLSRLVGGGQAGGQLGGRRAACLRLCRPPREEAPANARLQGLPQQPAQLLRSATRAC